MVLRPFDRTDFPRLISWIESPDFLYQWAGPFFTYPLEDAQLDRYLLLATGDPPTRRIFTALEATGGELNGRVEIQTLDGDEAATIVRGPNIRVAAGEQHRARALFKPGRPQAPLSIRVANDDGDS